MASRDDRKPIAGLTGVYKDEAQFYATVHVRGGGFREKRFPLATPLTDIDQWRNTTRIALLTTAKRGTAPGSFARDAQRFLKDFTAHLSRNGQSARVELQPWIAAFKDWPRGRITPADVARVRSEWLAADVAPKTINNRVSTLARMYRCLDGRQAWTPCDDLQPLHVHRTPMQFVDDETIRAVDLKLQEREQQDARRSKKTRARHRVLMSTGRRPSELMRAQPGDVDLQRRIWLPRDGKGGFSPGVYLNDDMLAAWEFFIQCNAWGPFKTQKHAQRLRAAGWPAHIKPYQARHTVGITLSERGIDLDDVGAMLGHKRRETTRKHYVPVLNSRMQKASEALEGRFQGWPAVQTTVQTSAIKSENSGRNLRIKAKAKTAKKPKKKR